MNDFSTKIKSTSTAMDNNNRNNKSNPPLKRTRAKRSCDFCRKRKARCDADHTIPCSNCKAWGFNCEFLTVRKKRGPPSVYVENLETRCKKMELLLTSLTKSSIKDIERNDFRPEPYLNSSLKNNISTNQYRSIKHDGVEEENESEGDDDDEEDDDSSFEDDDDSEYSNSHRNSNAMDDDSISTISNMQETLANLNLEDYDSIKYTGHSAGLQLLDENLFKSKSYIQWPGREDVALRLMPPNELLVVRSDRSVSGKRSDTRLDVGFSLTSSIFDERKSSNSWYLTPGSLTSNSANKNAELPSNSVIQKAAKLYFSHIHTFLPIVNKSRFETHDMKSSNVLLQAVLAVAFRFASRHFPKMFNKKSTLFADTYFRKVMLRLQDSYRARLRHVQAALLMTLYLDMDETDIESMQWYTLGKAIRMAQDIGLHRSCSNWNLPPSEIETRHRVFYGLYVLDRLMGARAGKPLTILDRDFDTDLPVPYEVYDDPTIEKGPSIYHSFINLIKLSEILGRILKALYAPKSKRSNSNANLDDPTILAVFDRRLKNWKATLDQPEGGVNVSPAQKVNLLIFYYTTMLLLHRPFIEFSSGNIKNIKANIVHGTADLDTLAADSRQACENAASNISVIIRQKQSLMSDPDSYSPLCLPTCFVYSMFQSSLIHLAIAIKNRDSLRRLRLLKRSIALLKQHEQLASALRAHNILVMLVAINTIDLENLLENEATREEDNISVLSEDGLSHQSPKSPMPSNKNNSELQFSVKATLPSHQHHHQQQIPSQMHTVSSNHIIPSCGDNMPKSSWYQRMMNTSIVGGITPDLHQGVTGNSSSHTLERLLPYAYEINQNQHQHHHSDCNSTTYQHRQQENDMHNQSNYHNNPGYYDLGPTTTVPSPLHNNTIPTTSSVAPTTTRVEIYNRQQDSIIYDESGVPQNNNNIPFGHNNGTALLSHQHNPHMPFQRSGLTAIPLHQTPLPFTASYSHNNSPRPLNHPSNSPATATTNPYPINYLPPSSLNWSDWGVYLGQQNSSIPPPPPPPQLDSSPEHNHLHINR